MASFRKIAKGWRAEVARKGVRKSKVFPSKREAQDWAAQQEHLILSGEIRGSSNQLFSEALNRYANEVSPRKRGERWEIMRLRALGKGELGAIRLDKLCAADFAKWRDSRLDEVAPGSVAREMTLLRSVLSIAQSEWGLLADNPMAGVKKPKEPEARNRLPTDDELERLALVAGEDLSTQMARAFLAFQFACETAMRSGEIVGMTWDNVDLERRVVHLPQTKNGTSRDVPLSLNAVAMLEALGRDRDPVFGLTTRNIDESWRKVRDRAAVENLHFHDSRHVAITRLSQKLDVLALAKMVGHKNISQLMTYYDESAEALARRLD